MVTWRHYFGRVMATLKKLARRVTVRQALHDLTHELHDLNHAVRQLGAQIMSNLSDLKDQLARIDAATNNIADDIRRLTEQIGTGMSQADVDEVKAGLEASAVKLEATAAVTPEPPVA